MKKIIVLTLFVGISVVSYSQYNEGGRDRYAVSNGQFDNGQYANNFFPRRERDLEIERINHEFRMKVYSIRSDRYLRHHQKKLAIRDAEMKRDRQIQMVNARFDGRFRDRYDRR